MKAIFALVEIAFCVVVATVATFFSLKLYEAYVDDVVNQEKFRYVQGTAKLDTLHGKGGYILLTGVNGAEYYEIVRSTTSSGKQYGYALVVGITDK